MVGCIGVVVAGLLLVGVVLVGGWFWVKSVTGRYAADAPMPLPKSELAQPADSELRAKLGEVFAAFEQGNPVTLELNGAELNAALAENTDLKDRVWVEIREGKLRGKISIPLEQTGLKSMEGRWLNGDVILGLTSTDGEVQMHIESMVVNGRDVPWQLTEVLRRRNLIESVEHNQEAAEYIRRIEGIDVGDNLLRVRFKPGN